MSVRKSERLLTLAWSGIENTCRQLLSLVFFFVSVRFLHPADLGLFSLGLALTCIASVFIDEPIGESLVQKANTTAADWDTGFTVNLILAAAFTILSTAAAWPLAAMLGEPALRFILPVLAFSSLVGALGNIQKARLARTLQFRRIAQTTLAAQMIGGLASVLLAMRGFGYWALIANVAIPATVSSAIYYRISSWKPRLRVDPSTIKSRLPYTVYSIAIRSIYLLRDQSPLIIASLFVNLTQLGFLSLALRVARSVSQLFEEVMGRPLLSLMSREQHDPIQFGRALAQVITIVGLFAVPSYVGLAIVGPRLIPLVFGAAWVQAGTFLPWICLVLAGWLVLHIVSVALRSRDLGRMAVQIGGPAAILDTVILAALIPLNLQWAMVAWAGRAFVTLPWAMHVLHRRLGVPVQLLAQQLTPPLLASVVMGVALIYVSRIGTLGVGFFSVGSSIAIGCVTYAVMVVAAMPSLRVRILSRFALCRP